MSTTETIRRLGSTLESEVTPFRAAFLHLILIGLPVGLGVIPLWDTSIHGWMGVKFFSGLFQPSSSMYNDRLLKENHAFSSPLEAFAVQDMGMRFIYQYELSLVACILLRNSRSAMHFFHKALVLCSSATIMAMAWLQTLHLRADFTPFEPNFFARMVLSHLFAISFSIWTMSLKKNRNIHEPPYSGGRWSIPGIALFIGSVSQNLSD
jgi:hypothetical protein